ncbi:MAG: hypothetical protein ACKVWR_00820 [Acidimicrobiales bacterium]
MDPNEAVRKAEAVLGAARQRGDVAGQVQALIELGGAYWAMKMADDALSAFEEARDSARAGGEPRFAAAADAQIGALLTAIGDYPRALDAIEASLTALRSLGDRIGQAQVLSAQAVALERSGRLAEAAAAAQEGASLAQETGGKETVLSLCSLQTRLYEQLGETSMALAAHSQAVKAARSLGKAAPLALALERHGACLLAQGRLTEALGATFEALKLQRGRSDDGSADAAYRLTVRLGQIYQQRGAWPEARASFSEALVMCLARGDAALQPYLEASLATALLGVGDADGAEAAAHQAIEGYRRLGDDVGVGRSLATLGQLAVLAGDHATARQVWDEAATLLAPLDPDAAAGVHKLMSQLTPRA